MFHTPSQTIFHTPLCHTPSLTHHFVSHHLWHTILHTTLSHTIFHTQLCHTPSFTHHLWHTIFDTPSLTHHLSHTPLCHTPSFAHTIFCTHFVTHHLWHTIFHTTLSHTIFHTQLCHTPSLTHIFVTRSLSHTIFTHTIFHTQLCHTHIIFLCHTPSFTYSFVTRNLVLLLDPPPPPLSFLPSQHLVLIIGRSCLVGFSGSLILPMLLRIFVLYFLLCSSMFVLYSSVLLTLSIFMFFFATISITFFNLHSYAYSCFLYSSCFYFSYLFFPSSGASKNHHQLPAEAEVFVPDAAAALRGRELSSDPWGVGLSLSILKGWLPCIYQLFWGQGARVLTHSHRIDVMSFILFKLRMIMIRLKSF